MCSNILNNFKIKQIMSNLLNDALQFIFNEEVSPEDMKVLEGQAENDSLLAGRIAEEESVRNFNDEKKMLLGMDGESNINHAVLEDEIEETKDGKKVNKKVENPTNPR